MATLKAKWQMLATFVWVGPKGQQQKIPVRFSFRECPTTAGTIEQIVSFQQGYSAAPDEVEVWPPTPIANSSLPN